MGELFTPMHIMIILVVAVVLFGGRRLPELGKGLGEGIKGFKDGLKGIDEPAKPVASVTPKTEADAHPKA
jgi:sec-independent protein translocase protein TatA